tara:strand:+ start:92 stop:256 length:165 start_codon:yes stop_codon:yes gene_type:complete
MGERKGNNTMTLARLMTILHFEQTPVRPKDISVGRWNGMVKMAKKMLGIIKDNP